MSERLEPQLSASFDAWRLNSRRAPRRHARERAHDAMLEAIIVASRRPRTRSFFSLRPRFGPRRSDRIDGNDRGCGERRCGWMECSPRVGVVRRARRPPGRDAQTARVRRCGPPPGVRGTEPCGRDRAGQCDPELGRRRIRVERRVHGALGRSVVADVVAVPARSRGPAHRGGADRAGGFFDPLARSVPSTHRG